MRKVIYLSGMSGEALYVIFKDIVSHGELYEGLLPFQTKQYFPVTPTNI